MDVEVNDHPTSKIPQHTAPQRKRWRKLHRHKWGKKKLSTCVQGKRNSPGKEWKKKQWSTAHDPPWRMENNTQLNNAKGKPILCVNGWNTTTERQTTWEMKKEPPNQKSYPSLTRLYVRKMNWPPPMRSYVRVNRPGKEWRCGYGSGGCLPTWGQPAGGVCMWARTDSPATLHSQP